MVRYYQFIICLVACASTAECAKILFFICRLAKSHQIVFHPIIRELANRGHEVDFYTHHPMKNPPKTLNQISFPMDDFAKRMLSTERAGFAQAFRTLAGVVLTMRTVGESKACYSSPQAKEVFTSNRTYDLVMGEFVLMQEQFAYLIHKFNALGVAVQSFPDNHWLNEISGLPINPSYMLPVTSEFTDRMNFLERLWNFGEILWVTIYEYYYVTTHSQQLADQHITYEGWECRPPVMKMVSDLALILISAHHSLSYSYPRAPHVKEVLGTHVEKVPPQLPKDLQEFMDSAEHGVVYFSLGSITSVQVLKTIKVYEPLLKVLSGLKQKVVWKWTSWSGEKPPEVPNIKFRKWIPQQSVLAHNKTKLFIAHGGFGGLTEAIGHGIPVIGIPVFADQIKNIRLAVQLGLGVELPLDRITESSVNWSTHEVLHNPRYKQEIMKRSAMFWDRPMKPTDEAVYWIEYVLRHGKVLQPESARMPFYQLYLLDIIGFIIICAAIITVISKRLVTVTTRFIKNAILTRMSKTRVASERKMKLKTK